MDLKEIRAGYRDVLTAYSELMDSPMTKRRDDEMEGRGERSECPSITARAKLRRVAPKLQQLADQSGNVRVWRRGEPLDGLAEGMKARIERARKFGF